MMKKCILFLFMGLIALTIWSQTPSRFNYQAVVRNSSGDLIKTQNIGFRLSVLQGSISGEVVYKETQQVNSNVFGVCNLKVGNGFVEVGDVSIIDWANGPYFLKVEIDPVGGNAYTNVGTSELASVPYSMFADRANEAASIENSVLYFTDTDTLFAVKDRNGNIVFAVFPDGAKVYVNDQVKGKLGGFAVSGRGATKSEIDYLVVTSDSTRIFLDEAKKGSLGGFAVSGRGAGKVEKTDYFNVSGRNSLDLNIIDPSQPRMLWYPRSEALLVGRVLIEHPDSVGLNSLTTGFESKAIGDYSQALGYKSIARQDYSTAIGKNAVANGLNSFAFGNAAVALSDDAVAIGSGALAIGAKSFAMGSAGVDTLGNFTDYPKAIGDFSFAMGLGTKSTGTASVSLGANTTASGNFSTSLGFFSEASGERSVALGPFAKATAYGSAAIGYRNIASGAFSLAGGVGSTAEGYGCISLGAYCLATGSRSVALGDACTSDGFGSFAAGKSSVAVSGGVAIGVYATATGSASYAFGRYSNTNYKEGSFVFSDGIDKSTVAAKQDGQVVFLASGGLHFHTSKDTLDTKTFVITGNSGNVGIGTLIPDKKLHVVGDARITGNIYYGTGTMQYPKPDFVFKEDYNFKYSINEIETFINEHNHLPWLTSADAEKDGINLTRMQFETLEAVENLQLQVIELDNQNRKLIEKIEKLESIVNQLSQK